MRRVFLTACQKNKREGASFTSKTNEQFFKVMEQVKKVGELINKIAHCAAGKNEKNTSTALLHTDSMFNVIKLTTRLIVHMMFSFIDFMLPFEFPAWSNRLCR